MTSEAASCRFAISPRPCVRSHSRAISIFPTMRPVIPVSLALITGQIVADELEESGSLLVTRQENESACIGERRRACTPLLSCRNYADCLKEQIVRRHRGRKHRSDESIHSRGFRDRRVIIDYARDFIRAVSTTISTCRKFREIAQTIVTDYRNVIRSCE